MYFSSVLRSKWTRRLPNVRILLRSSHEILLHNYSFPKIRTPQYEVKGHTRRRLFSATGTIHDGDLHPLLPPSTPDSGVERRQEQYLYDSVSISPYLPDLHLNRSSWTPLPPVRWNELSSPLGKLPLRTTTDVDVFLSLAKGLASLCLRYTKKGWREETKSRGTLWGKKRVQRILLWYLYKLINQLVIGH